MSTQTPIAQQASTLSNNCAMCRVSFAICASIVIALISVTKAANADLFVAADNTADLYVNGNRLSKTFDWQGYVRYTINVRVGDVIAVEAEDLGAGVYGVIAALVSRSGGNKCVTNINKGPWRAINLKEVRDAPWKTKGYDDRFWPVPVASTVTPPQSGSALSFPYRRTGADYVWAFGARGNSQIALRLVVTERCF